MTLEFGDSDKALVRQFLATSAANKWLEYASKNFPKLERAKVSVDIYNVSLYEKEGWNSCLDFLRNSVREERPVDYGVPPIDTVTD